MEPLIELLGRIIVYGILGCFNEVAWNALRSNLFRAYRKWGLRGTVSLWMFPIYGIGVSLGFDAARALIGGWPWIARSFAYLAGIWTIEIVVGHVTNRRLWNYSDSRWHWRGLIRFDSAPFWMLFGLTVECIRDFLDPIIRASL